MSQADLERLVGRAILDASFRKQLFRDPQETLRRAGLELSEQELDSVATMDMATMEAIAEGLYARLMRASSMINATDKG